MYACVNRPLECHPLTAGRSALRRLRCRVARATDPATCDEEMPAVVPTGPVRAKPAAPSPFERLGDENPAPQTNLTAALDAALLRAGAHSQEAAAARVASAHTVTAKCDFCT